MAANPSWWSMLSAGGMSFAPALLSMLYGGRGQRRDLDERQARIAALLDPNNVMDAATRTYGTMWAGAPGQAVRSGAFTSGNLIREGMARRMGATGGVRTGIGALSASLADAAGTNLRTQGRLGLWNSAYDSTRALRMAQAQMYGNMPYPQYNSQDLFGAGFNAYAPLLAKKLFG